MTSKGFSTTHKAVSVRPGQPCPEVFEGDARWLDRVSDYVTIEGFDVKERDTDSGSTFEPIAYFTTGAGQEWASLDELGLELWER